MILENEQIQKLCNLINEELRIIDKKITFYLIGGGALMFYGAKSSTKDLDIIVKSDNEYKLTKYILEKMGFIPINIEPEYKNLFILNIIID